MGRQQTGFARLPLSGQLGQGQLDSTSFLCEREWAEVLFGCVCVRVCVDLCAHGCSCVCVSSKALHGCYFVFETIARPWPELGTYRQ